MKTDKDKLVARDRIGWIYEHYTGSAYVSIQKNGSFLRFAPPSPEGFARCVVKLDEDKNPSYVRHSDIVRIMP